jgi:hypothetical protein
MTNPSLEPASGTKPFTANNWLWIGAFVFLGLGAAALALLFIIPPKGNPGIGPLVPAFGSFLVGFLCLSLALCGVGKDTVADPYSHGVRVALERLESEAAPPGAVRWSAPNFEGRCRAKGFLGQFDYRVVLTENDALFCSLHLPLPDAGYEKRSLEGRTQMVLAAGAVGGLVGALGSHFRDKEVQHSLRRRNAVESAPDLATLRRFADEDPESFILPLDELKDVSFDGPSLGNRIFIGGDVQATARFLHADRGSIAVDLYSFDEAASVLKELRRKLGGSESNAASMASVRG